MSKKTPQPSQASNNVAKHSHKNIVTDEFTALREIMDLLPGHIYWYDLNGIYHGCNKQQAKSFGFSSADELIGKSFHDLQPKAEIEAIKKTNELVCKTGQTLSVEEPGTYEGKPKIFLSKKLPWRDQNGEIIGVIGVSFDVTIEKKQTLSLLHSKKNTETTLRQIIDNLTGHIYVKDVDGTYLYCNKLQAESLGFPIENIIGKTDYDLSSKKQADQYRTIELDIIKQQKTVVAEESATYNGKERLFLSKKSPLRDEGSNIIGIVGISVDITAEKEAEKLKQAKRVAEKQSEVMKLISSAIAHELRTPQASIDMLCEQLKDALPILLARYKASLDTPCDLPTLPDTLYESINEENMGERLLRINNNSRTIVNMMNKNMLQGELNGKSIQFSPKHIIENAINDYPYRNRIERKTIKGICGEDFTVAGDPDLFELVILNLLKNSIYHVLHCGKGHIEITLASGENNNTVYFNDTGPGIPPAYIDKIFDNFFTINTDNGTGVGLSLCKSVIENNMRGKIWCESELGEYTRFCIQLPKVN